MENNFLNNKFDIEKTREAVRLELVKYFNRIIVAKPQQNLFYIVQEAIEKPLIEETLIYCKGSQVRASKVLGVHRNTIKKKIDQYKIKPFLR